jgi:hypothetical protein
MDSSDDVQPAPETHFSSTPWPTDPGLLTLFAIGGAALLCTCLMWLGERRARAESEANARAFRAAALLASTQHGVEPPQQDQSAEVHATAQLAHVSIAVADVRSVHV